MKITFSENGHRTQHDLTSIIIENSEELNSSDDLDKLIEKIGAAKFVLLGEASHGTHEYYTLRAQISKKLIEQKGFSFIAVEGDWPDCYRLNRYIKKYPNSGENALEVLQQFNRWPTWMWANWEITALAEWLRKYNEPLARKKKVGFYGLDVYSLWESLEAILAYLKEIDHDAWETAQKAVQCFAPHQLDEGRSYAKATRMVPMSCEREVIQLLNEINSKINRYNTDRDAVFSIAQNARVAANAEKYYRTMIRSGADSWNIRDRHMMDTLNRLMEFHGNNAKAIIWEHNTHIGDARATDMFSEGMVNVGQLVREQHGAHQSYVIGFGSYKGTVIAGRKWGDVMRLIHMPDAASESWEGLLHDCQAKDRIVYMNESMKHYFGHIALGHRAIGVVYHPQYEQLGNYMPSILPERYDAFVFIDETKALFPLQIADDAHQIPETYPFGV